MKLDDRLFKSTTPEELVGVVEHFDLDDARARLAELPPIEGEWPKPASLARFGQTRMTIKQLKRFVSKIMIAELDYHTPCWIWIGGMHEKGYGRFHLGFDPVDGSKITAYSHRIAFEHWIGFPPPGYIVDHQCNHKPCANPTHIWPESNKENLRLADERRPWKRRNQYSQE